MGNCYGEDGDSEDEYYGYYGKNNRLKPKPNSTPPNPNLTLSEPEPNDSDDDSFSENGNPDHSDPHHSPSETDPYEPNYSNPDPTPSESDRHEEGGNDDLDGLFESDETDEHGAREGKANGEHRHERPEPGKGEIGEPGKLERGTQGRQELKCELGYNQDDGANGYAHSDHHRSPASTAARDDRDPHAPTTRSPTCALHPAPSNTQALLSTPTPSPPAPPPPAHATSPVSHQQSHVTALKNAQHHAPAFNDVPALAPANENAPVPHVTYPRRDRLATPRSWSAIGNEQMVPKYRVSSFPISLSWQYKRRCYKRSCAVRTPTPQTIPTSHTPHSHAPIPARSSTNNALATTRASVAPLATDKLDHESAAHQLNKPTNPYWRINNGTAPYCTIRSRLPPWPIKCAVSPPSLIINSRPPPWPILPTPSPILSTANSRPPPWPILPNNTLRNLWNARCRPRRRSLDIFYLLWTLISPLIYST
jgi:hypothetical protein